MSALQSNAAAREKRAVALTSVLAAIVLTALKLTVGLATGSLGLLAEAAHSGLDLAAAIITYFAVRVSDKPADAEHLYGHGKIENLSALAETLLLVLTCAWIVYEGVERLFFKYVPVDATFWAFAVVLVSIVVDVGRSRALMRVAKAHQSQALEADALHFSTDIWSSAVVLLGLALVKIGDYFGRQELLGRADAAAALLVAVIVVWVSYRLGRRTVDALLDRAPEGLHARIASAACGVPGVLRAHNVRARAVGNQTFVDLEIDVQRGLSLERSHDIGGEVEARIQAAAPNADVVVHVNPARAASETPPDRVRAIAANHGFAVHNMLLSGADGRYFLDQHVEVDPQLSLRAAHARVEELEQAIYRELPEIANITTHIEPHYAPLETLRDVTDAAGDVVERVTALVAHTPGVDHCHAVRVRADAAGRFLSLHCVFDAGLSVGDVHRISTELERAIRQEIPGLIRVTTHPEPVEGDVPPERGGAGAP